MSRIGIMSVAAPGHYFPLTALGRRLQSRGHDVVYFQVADLESPIRASGLEYHRIGGEDFPLGTVRGLDEEIGQLQGLAALRCAIRRVVLSSKMILRDAPAAIRAEGVDALIVDQCEMAGGSVAESLGLPFVSVAAALPLNLDDSVPFPSFPWSSGVGPGSRLRNRLGNAFFEWTSRPILKVVNQHRQAWGLEPAIKIDSLYSKLSQIAQLPAALELPGRRLPPGFAHSGPWTDPEARATVAFPWSHLDPRRPLVYASMGTLQNGLTRPYRVIAEACAGLDLQLVISLGGGRNPSSLGDLPGDPLVVGFAPQLELVRRSALTISHGGLNTALESLSSGVPLVVLPVTNDQPGVGTRVEWSGVGRSIPVGRLTIGRLREAVQAVLNDPSYRRAAEGMRSSIEAADGLGRAADLIGEAFDRGREPAYSSRLTCAPNDAGWV